MKHILSALFALILLFGLSVFALGEENEVLWSDVVAAFYDDSVALPAGISIAHNGTNHIISGNGADTILKNVVIDSRNDSTSFGAGSYTFRNLTLDGEFSIISEENKAYTLVLEESVRAEDAKIELYSGKWIYNGKVDPHTELHRGNIHATIRCQTDIIIAYADYNSSMELYNYGNTRKIDVRPNQNSKIKLENYGSFAVNNRENVFPTPIGFGTLFMESSCNSSLDVINNSPHTQVLYAWAYENGKLNIVNNGNADRVDFNSEYNSDLRFTNNGTITNRRVDDGGEWGDDAVIFRIDANSKLTLDGKGKILPGHQHYDYYATSGHLGGIRCNNDPDNLDGIPGPSIVLNARNVYSDDATYAEISNAVLKIAKRITLDWNQIVPGEAPFPVVAVRRGGEDYESGQSVRPIICPIQSKDTHPTPVHKKSNLDTNATYDDAPILFTEDGVEDLFLRADNEKRVGNTISYDLTMVDAYNTEHSFKGTALVFIPYPDGMTRAQADGHEFELKHTTEKSVDIFSTKDGTLIRTESGVYAEVSSLSPFALSWTQYGELPQTGDNSHIALWLAMLVLAGTAILTLKRKTA